MTKRENVPAPISQIGRYEVLGTIARGGMATVYLARLAATGGFSREFALKVIHPHLAAQKGFRARLLEEARLASRVRHPNAVSTIDAGEDQGYAYLVNELIDGVNLRQLLLHRSRPFSAPVAGVIVAQVCRGLHALHTATSEGGEPLGMVHRDVSPHNVMIDRQGRAILIDLGLAKAADREGITQVGVLAGKLPYMSPEQARLEPLDSRSDVFAMGTVLYQLTTGELPFGDSSSRPTLERLQNCDLTRVHAGLERHELPQWIAELVLACLKPDPEQRIQSAEELADAIGQELQQLGHDEATIRRTLASIVQDAADEIGGLETMPSVVPALGNTRPAGQARHAVRWALIGGLAASLGAFVMFGDTGERTDAAPAPGVHTSRAAGSLAADGVPAVKDERPTRRRRPKTKTSASASEPESEEESAEAESPLTPVEVVQPEVAEDAPKPRRHRTSASLELKPNPYAR